MTDQFEAMKRLARAWVDRMLGPTYRERFPEDTASTESAFVAAVSHTVGLIEEYLRRCADGDEQYTEVSPGVLREAANAIARGEWLPKEPEPALFTSDHDVESDDA